MFHPWGISIKVQERWFLMINKKLPIVSLILYILAGLFLAFAVWAAVFSFQYISEMAAMGQIVVSDNLFNIVSFHMQNFGQFIIFSAILFGIGWIGQTVSAPIAEERSAAGDDDASMEFVMEDLQTEIEEEEE